MSDAATAQRRPDASTKPAPVLPVALDDGLKLDWERARAIGESLAPGYCHAEPFPHVVLDDFLPEPLVRRALAHFPRHKLGSDINFELGYGGLHKRQVMPEDCDSVAREVFHFFNSRPFLEFMEGLTGIPGLIPDPYFTGGGYHETRRGGKLGIHSDFRLNEKLALERRVNVILYLNERWDDAWGGKLELWSRDMASRQREIAPLFNRAVVFNTDLTSFHGHPAPLECPEDTPRRSIALFYYTASRAVFEEVKIEPGRYRSRPEDDPRLRRQIGRLNATMWLNHHLPAPVLRYARALRRRMPF